MLTITRGPVSRMLPPLPAMRHDAALPHCHATARPPFLTAMPLPSLPPCAGGLHQHQPAHQGLGAQSSANHHLHLLQRCLNRAHSLCTGAGHQRVVRSGHVHGPQPGPAVPVAGAAQVGDVGLPRLAGCRWASMPAAGKLWVCVQACAWAAVQAARMQAQPAGQGAAFAKGRHLVQTPFPHSPPCSLSLSQLNGHTLLLV